MLTYGRPVVCHTGPSLATRVGERSINILAATPFQRGMSAGHFKPDPRTHLRTNSLQTHTIRDHNIWLMYIDGAFWIDI